MNRSAGRIVSFAAAITAFGALAACSDDPVALPDAAVADALPSADATETAADSGISSNPDAGEPSDTSVAADAAPPGADATPGQDAAQSVPDSGGPHTPSIEPGTRIVFSEGEIRLGMTFQQVTALLGAADRRTAGMGSRSYEWDLSGGAMATVWFGNTNLDRDDSPPMDVDATDTVLWVAVTGTYTGMTPAGIALGSTRAAVTAAYGAAPRSVTLDNPMGTLDSYYTRGILVAYQPAPNETARTITVSRAYTREPDGRIDAAQGKLVFGGTSGSREIRGALFGGTSKRDVEMILGAPDTQGDVMLGSQTLELYSYAFIGIEVFFTRSDTVMFLTVHPPYYGRLGAMAADPGLGSTRAEIEAYLTGQLMFGSAATSSIQGVVCYEINNSRAVGVTYSMDMPERATSIVVAHPAGMACN